MARTGGGAVPCPYPWREINRRGSTQRSVWGVEVVEADVAGLLSVWWGRLGGGGEKCMVLGGSGGW